jgi:hypothetical protein
VEFEELVDLEQISKLMVVRDQVIIITLDSFKISCRRFNHQSYVAVHHWSVSGRFGLSPVVTEKASQNFLSFLEVLRVSIDLGSDYSLVSDIPKDTGNRVQKKSTLGPQVQQVELRL